MNSTSPESSTLLRRLARRYSTELGLLLAIAAVLAIAMFSSDAYGRKPVQNAQEILRQSALLGVFAIGAAIVIIAGGIDLSSGSVIAFSGSICAALMLVLAPVDAAGHRDTSDLSMWIFAVAILGTLFFGFLIGTFHAWLITVVGLPPFVATLASLVGLRSMARVFIQETTGVISDKTDQIYVRDPAFGMLGNTWWIPLVIFLVICFLAWVLMSRTVVGRHLYALGGNETAAHLSGIRTDRLKWLAYCIGAITASIAGILYTAEVGSAAPQVLGKGYELNAIAAAVVGGCSLQGGLGTISGTMLGVVFLRVVIDAVAKIVRFGSADDFEGIIVGVLVVLAVAFNELRHAGRATSKQFFPGILGIWAIAILTLLCGAMATVMFGSTAGWATSVLTAVVLSVRKLAESRTARKQALGMVAG